MPSFNNNACVFFTKLNDIFGWKGLHATNGGEYHIKELGYFVDYYEPTLNLVIEWDEKTHYDVDGNLRKKDILREEEIKKYLSCKFIRIKQYEFKEETIFKKLYEEINNTH